MTRFLMNRAFDASSKVIPLIPHKNLMAPQSLAALEVGVDKGRPDGCHTVGVNMPGQALHGERPLGPGQGKEEGYLESFSHLLIKTVGDGEIDSTEGDIVHHAGAHRSVRAGHERGH